MNPQPHRKGAHGNVIGAIGICLMASPSRWANPADTITAKPNN